MKCEPADLRLLLEHRADPNFLPAPGRITALQEVMTFARREHGRSMRELLLQFGAHETEDDRDQGSGRLRDEANEAAWMRAFPGDTR